LERLTFAYRFNRRISVLSLTLSRAFTSIVGFAVIFVIVNTAFNSSLYIILNDKLSGYRDYISVFCSSLASMLGKTDIVEVMAVTKLGKRWTKIFVASKLLFSPKIYECLQYIFPPDSFLIAPKTFCPKKRYWFESDLSAKFHKSEVKIAICLIRMT
jgi:hypothetical protein